MREEGGGGRSELTRALMAVGREEEGEERPGYAGWETGEDKEGMGWPAKLEVEVRRLLQVPDPPRHLLALVEGKTMQRHPGPRRRHGGGEGDWTGGRARDERSGLTWARRGAMGEGRSEHQEKQMPGCSDGRGTRWCWGGGGGEGEGGRWPVADLGVFRFLARPPDCDRGQRRHGDPRAGCGTVQVPRSGTDASV